MLLLLGVVLGCFVASCVPSAAATVARQRWARVLALVVVGLLTVTMEPDLRSEVLGTVGVLLLYFGAGYLVVNQDRLYSAWKAYRSS